MNDTIEEFKQYVNSIPDDLDEANVIDSDDESFPFQEQENLYIESPPKIETKYATQD